MTEAKFTKGPWSWEVNEKHKDVNLCGDGIEVLRFKRWGMQGAMPTFTEDWHGSRLQCVEVTSLSEPIKGREHHAHWCKTLNHPDAHLIAASPDLYEMLAEILYNFEVGNSDHTQINDEMIPRINNLLAKARGEL